jgi:hypothetical protein
MLQAVVLLVSLGARAGAQAVPWDAAQQVNGSSRGRVRLASGEWGTVYRPVLDSGGLYYSVGHRTGQDRRRAPPPPPIPVARIALLQVPYGSHALLGGKIGAGIGCVLSLMVVAAASTDGWTAPSGAEAGRAIVSLTFNGAGVGALIRSASPRWKTVYRAPPL